MRDNWFYRAAFTRQNHQEIPPPTPRSSPRSPPSLPHLRAVDQGMAETLESLLSDNTRPVYATRRAPACPTAWPR